MPVAAGPFEGPQNTQCQACGAPQDPGTFAATGFDPMPAYIPNDVVVLTFDDVPNGTITTGDLATLKSNNLHVDFFTNTMNYQGTDGYPIITQIITEGHHVGNHTMTHPHLGMEPNAAAVESEISGVESVVSMLTMGAKPHLTRFRAPFGEPFQANWPQEADSLVAPVVAKYAVEVDWNFDSGDSAGMDPLSEIMANLATPGKGSTWGIILMHGTLSVTNKDLQGIITYLKTSGFKLATVEDYICWEYGKHSWDIVNQLNTGAARVEN
jgi:peptidoglycan/xylan/chitin deacetylase (PgdA/CDA1 family)